MATYSVKCYATVVAELSKKQAVMSKILSSLAQDEYERTETMLSFIEANKERIHSMPHTIDTDSDILDFNAKFSKDELLFAHLVSAQTDVVLKKAGIAKEDKEYDSYRSNLFDAICSEFLLLLNKEYENAHKDA